ncbi:hypothetical protein AAEU32_06210 [Pseudoalteromonas sp. SSDWG2]|uniref:hypothetical protein n=1 Tax=Pseudoalteromonas sp. SSDWG2 TaxID=3139391 RepID=UPI003BAB27E8
MLIGMKTQGLLAGTTACALLFGAYSLQSSPDSIANASTQCQCSYAKSNNSPEYAKKCATQQEEQSWFAWFTGDSRSAQFHYLDLLELLSRDDSKNARHFSSNTY